jgi:hypothetical protein
MLERSKLEYLDSHPDADTSADFRKATPQDWAYQFKRRNIDLATLRAYLEDLRSRSPEDANRLRTLFLENFKNVTSEDINLIKRCAADFGVLAKTLKVDRNKPARGI